MKQVAIFAATGWELNAVGQACGVRVGGVVNKTCSMFGVAEVCQVRIFQTGIGPENARRAIQHAFSLHTIDLVISTGFACALSDSKIGDILIGSEVMSFPDRSGSSDHRVFKVPAHFVEYAQRMVRKAGIPFSQGRFVSTSIAICDASEKSRIQAETGAVGLDMESAVIAREACEHNIDMVIVRGVSDLVDENLPVNFNLFFQGGIQRIWGGLSCLLRPSCWVGLNRLRKQSTIAVHHLTIFFQTCFEDIQTAEPKGLI